MLTADAKAELEHQQYRIVGEHSAVKTCGWTKTMINGEGGCYKLKFYGIMSNQCMQMTTSISCANRCTFCWRGYKAPVAKEWMWKVDEPEMILTESLRAHHKLLVGFGGSHRANKASYEKSKQVKHVALSLTGEPITYPKMNELIDGFHAQGISTFLVTNSQYPEHIKNLKPITQLYCSVDAPTKELLKEVDVPLFSDYWERMLLSLKYLSEKKQRTCIRMTLIKGINDVDLDKYAGLVEMGSPDFIEVKSYMHVGPSQQRLSKDNMALHEEVVAFCLIFAKFLPEYEIMSEHIASRVVLFAKKKFKKVDGWYTWIDFPRFAELANSGKEFGVDDYLKKTPQTGLSGKGSIDYMPELTRKRFLEEHPEWREKFGLGIVSDNEKIYVNEKTDEMSFYRGV